MATVAVSATTQRPQRALATPISWALRAGFTMEVLFGLLAILSIGLAPQNTATNFAWPIKPDVMAATIGAFYFATALLLVPLLFARTWQEVRATTLPAAAFTTTMLLTTFLHWDKFSVGTLPFYVWFASYLLPPPIFLSLYWWHQRRSAPVGVGGVWPVAGWLRACLAANGALLTGLALVMYVVPTLLQRIAPWQFTPLTVRTICGWLVGVGLLQIALAREGDWLRMRFGSVQSIALPFVLVLQLVRFPDQVRWESLTLWVLLADAVLIAALLLSLWVLALTERRDAAAATRGR